MLNNINTSNFEFLDHFNVDDLINPKNLELLIDSNPMIMNRIDKDFREHNLENINYKTMINFYNQIFNSYNININRVGIHSDYFNIINECDYISSDKDTNYLKNLANLLTLKHLQNSIDKTKIQINNKIQKLRADIISEASHKFTYNSLLRKNINDIFPEDDLFKIRTRPESANPYNRNNSKQTLPNEDSI